jgi:hypothetical protein
MPTHLQRLGLPPDADERAIKRAYAQRVKLARPDEDPAAFQELHEAYQACLQQCHARADIAAESVMQDQPALPPPALETEWVELPPALELVWTEEFPIAPVPALTALQIPCEAAQPPAGEAQQESFTALNFPAFYVELLQQAADADAPALGQWLSAQPALWGLQTKRAVREQLFVRLGEAMPPLNEKIFDELMGFFDLQHVGSGHDALVLQTLQRQLHAAWKFSGMDFAARARRLHATDPNLGFNDKVALRFLKRISVPRSFWRNLLEAARPGSVKQTAQLIRSTLGKSVATGPLPQGLDAGQLNFWLVAADRERVSASQIGIALVQGLGAFVLVTLWGTMLFMLGAKDVRGHALEDWSLILAACAVWACVPIWRAVVLSQQCDENRLGRWRWASWSWIPAMGALTALISDQEWDLPGTVIAFLAIACAFQRWRARAGRGPMPWRELGIRSILSLGYLGFIVLVGTLAMPMFGAAIALLLWAMDVYHFFRWRRKRS